MLKFQRLWVGIGIKLSADLVQMSVCIGKSSRKFKKWECVLGSWVRSSTLEEVGKLKKILPADWKVMETLGAGTSR